MSTVCLITFRVSRRRREMYNGYDRLCVSVCVFVPRRIPTLLHEPECNDPLSVYPQYTNVTHT